MVVVLVVVVVVVVAVAVVVAAGMQCAVDQRFFVCVSGVSCSHLRSCLCPSRKDSGLLNH